jgi:hypothetical protein
MSHSRHLVLMDTDRIKEYIFSTNRLKEIRGASLLLDKLNTQGCRTLLADFNGEEVFIGGGGVLATFPDKPLAERYIAAVQAAYRKETHGATITGVAVPIPPDSWGEQDALRHARVELRLAKGVRAGTQALLTSPYFRLCQSCNRYPVTHTDEGDELCQACYTKREVARAQPDETAEAGEQVTFPPYSGYSKFATRASVIYGDDRWQGLTWVPAKLDRLEGQDTSHIGFIHADVNNLGAFLEQQDSLANIKALGKKIEEALEGALVDAVRKLGLAPRRQGWPFLIIIMGGDDVTLIVPAKRAVPLANELCLAYEQRIKTALGEVTNDRGDPVGELALSAGVVIAKPAHPAYALADRAEDLVKSAKRRSHELKAEGYGPVPTLDFQVIHTPTANPIQEVREDEYFQKRDSQEYWYTSRPLPCRTVDPWRGVDTLLETIRILRHSDFPRNKLNEWADLIYTSEIEQILGWQELQTRVTSEAHQALMRAISSFGLSRERVFAQPGGIGEPYVTPLVDMIELYDFVED